MRPRSLLRSLLLVTAFVLTFFGGAAANQAGWLPGIGPALAADSRLELNIFWEAWNLIDRHFVDQEKLDPRELSYVAINALVEALGDTGHTRFLTPEEAQQHQQSVNGSQFVGIGARLGLDEQARPMIVKPFSGSPAEQAGLRAGDRLLTVDGADVTALSIGEIVNLIRGEPQTAVTLTVTRPGLPDPLEIVIIRNEITVPSVEWTFLPDSKVALIRLNQFSVTANDEIVAALTAIQDRGGQGIVIDLRGNPGGLLRQAIAVTSQFLSEGNVLSEADGQGNRRDFPVQAGGIAQDIPLVVLVDHTSASSSEIFAGAIQDHQRGLVVGDTTFGTGTVLTPFNLSDGSVLLLGTSEWLTAAGRSIRNQGITPDVMVSLAVEGGGMLTPDDIKRLTREELFHSGDVQLLEALKLLNNCWAKRGCEYLNGPNLAQMP